MNLTPQQITEALIAVAWWSAAWAFVWSGAMFYAGYWFGRRK